METAPEKHIEITRRSWRRWAVWIAVLAAATAVGVMTGGIARNRARELGRKTAEEAVALMAEAHEASAAKQMGRAEEILARLRSLLEGAEPRSREPLYTIVLVDLASLKISADPPRTEAIVQARDLLNEAWSNASPNDFVLRNRIASTRGLVEVLDGDLTAARQWYEEALALVPSDEAARAKLMLLDSGRASAPPETTR